MIIGLNRITILSQRRVPLIRVKGFFVTAREYTVIFCERSLFATVPGCLMQTTTCLYAEEDEGMYLARIFSAPPSSKEVIRWRT